jgi:hypothetical protein
MAGEDLTRLISWADSAGREDDDREDGWRLDSELGRSLSWEDKARGGGGGGVRGLGVGEGRRREGSMNLSRGQLGLKVDVNEALQLLTDGMNIAVHCHLSRSCCGLELLVSDLLEELVIAWFPLPSEEISRGIGMKRVRVEISREQEERLEMLNS